MDGVETVGLHVIREPAGAADAADDDEVLALDAELGKRALERVEDRVIAATRAPADVVGCDEVLAGEFRDGGNVLNFSGHGFSVVEKLKDAFADFAHLEGASHDFGHGNGIDQIVGADEQ